MVITGWGRGSGPLARRGSHALSAPSTRPHPGVSVGFTRVESPGSQDVQDASVPPPFWSGPPPIAGTMEPVCHLITRRPRPPRSASNNPPVANSNPTSNSRNTSQCNNTSPPRCWGGKVSRGARALTPSSSRSSAPSPPTVSRPPGLGSGAAHRPARPSSSSSSASSPGSSSSSSASSPRNGPHPWPLLESRDMGPAPSA